MKKLFIIFALVVAFINCNGQRYEVWVKTTDHKYESVRNLAHSNDSILTLYSNPTFFILSKEFSYRWEDIDEVKVRNKSVNQLGSLVGLGVGLICFDLYYKSPGDYAIILAPIVATSMLLGGTLAGYLLTNKKIIIPLTGKTPAEKSQALNEKIQKRSR